MDASSHGPRLPSNAASEEADARAIETAAITRRPATKSPVDRDRRTLTLGFIICFFSTLRSIQRPLKRSLEPGREIAWHTVLGCAQIVRSRDPRSEQKIGSLEGTKPKTCTNGAGLSPDSRFRHALRSQIRFDTAMNRQFDWAAPLEAKGFAHLPAFITPEECREIEALWNDRQLFRSEVEMRRHGMGKEPIATSQTPCPNPLNDFAEPLIPNS
jgi:hypothetical protein